LHRATGTWTGIENRDPHTTVTFIQLACSGAKISAGLLQPYAGADPIRTDDEKSALCPPVQPDPSCIPPQIDQLGAIVGDRKIDALLISIGGNDMGFGTVASECALPFNDCRDAMLPVVDEGLQLARIRFDELAKAITAKLPVASHSVYLTEYPDPTVNAQGRYARPPGLLNGLLVREAQWASEYVIAKLNETLRGAADRHGWTLVDGVGPRFRGPGYGHGLAAGSERWFNTLEDSFVRQGPVPRLCRVKSEEPCRRGRHRRLRERLSPPVGFIYSIPLQIPRIGRPDRVFEPRVPASCVDTSSAAPRAGGASAATSPAGPRTLPTLGAEAQG